MNVAFFLSIYLSYKDVEAGEIKGKPAPDKYLLY